MFVSKFAAFLDTPPPSLQTSYMEAPLFSSHANFPRRRRQRRRKGGSGASRIMTTMMWPWRERERARETQSGERSRTGFPNTHRAGKTFTTGLFDFTVFDPKTPSEENDTKRQILFCFWSLPPNSVDHIMPTYYTCNDANATLDRRQRFFLLSSSPFVSLSSL